MWQMIINNVAGAKFYEQTKQAVSGQILYTKPDKKIWPIIVE